MSKSLQNDGSIDPSGGGTGQASPAGGSTTTGGSTGSGGDQGGGGGGGLNEGGVVVTIPAAAAGWPKPIVQGPNMPVLGGKLRLSVPAPLAGAGVGTEGALNTGIVYVGMSISELLGGSPHSRLRPGDVVIFPGVDNLNRLWFSGTAGDVVYPSVKSE